MAHRVDPNRGIYHRKCEVCRRDGKCRLRTVDNRNLMACVDGCPEQVTK